ncbi:GNAT family N-acetyltransferase [Clostridium grantii]|uniref:Acetyltransferase (GNAT) domain-containing protein n=1 Tax=Clostridium grantii DSM 8605 TaxID=1121316 RepID=A0A1M5XYY4_9CLOT|nr:GNAT family N-acetyltransferase [Clostridium grantii]SHI04952.1 Acetyltransferase (GNAT) domain-containing protein [Clostridium grantii DSM 8605]
MELKDYEILGDGEIDIIIYKKNSGDISKGRVPEYKFKIVLHNTDTVIGHINLRLGNSEKVLNYIGHVGYGIEEQYRGNKFAANACNIIKEVIKDHLMNKVIITCNPHNYASRKICETIGAKFIEIVDIPETSDAYSADETQKCRYEWIV